jgi:zinc and cadmium transporter
MLYTVMACLAGGILSLVVAGIFAFRISSLWLHRWVAFSAGVMLATTFLNILPEVYELAPDQLHELFGILLLGILAFFFLEKLSIWRHSHVSNDEGSKLAAPVAWNIVIGDAFHNFVDGILIAAAFLADPWLGLATTLAVIAHEIPQELGDFIILLHAGLSKRKAFLFNAFSSMTSVIGGILGYMALEKLQIYIPYVLMLSAASFLYIALTDLFPVMHKPREHESAFAQAGFIVMGVGVTFLIGHSLH